MNKNICNNCEIKIKNNLLKNKIQILSDKIIDLKRNHLLIKIMNICKQQTICNDCIFHNDCLKIIKPEDYDIEHYEAKINEYNLKNN